MTLLYEGKAKQVFNTDKPEEVIIQFKDDATAFNGEKKDTFAGKGTVNALFSRHFFDLLHSQGVKTHVISYLDEISMRAKKVEIFQLEVVVRNYAAGSICKREGYEKGLKFDPPMLEFFLKDDSKGDPLITKADIFTMNLATKEELDIIEQTTLKINSIISEYVEEKGITLVDFKVEFGKTSNGEVILADEISPDTCRFWIKGTTESLDKDVYRESKGELVSTYRRLADILGV
jgi:phosphoribosylaminoimidazole-succinocarboxamide synthase